MSGCSNHLNNEGGYEYSDNEVAPDRYTPALQLYLQLKAFARGCVANGDMTPGAERMMLKILTDWGKPDDAAGYTIDSLRWFTDARGERHYH